MATKEYKDITLNVIRKTEIRTYIEKYKTEVIYSSLENEENEIEILKLFEADSSEFYFSILFEIYEIKTPSEYFYELMRENLEKYYIFLEAILCPIKISFANFPTDKIKFYAKYFALENNKKLHLRKTILENKILYEFLKNNFNYEKLLILSILIREEENIKYFDVLIKSIINFESTNNNIKNISFYILSRYIEHENASIKVLSYLKSTIESLLEYQESEEYKKIIKFLKEKIENNFTIEYYLAELFSGHIQNIPNTENLFDGKHIEILFKNRHAILAAYRKYLQGRNLENIRLVFADLYNFLNLFFQHKEIIYIKELNKILLKYDIKDLIYKQIKKGESTASKLLILIIQLEWYE